MAKYFIKKLHYNVDTICELLVGNNYFMEEEQAKKFSFTDLLNIFNDLQDNDIKLFRSGLNEYYALTYTVL
jgi:hypothetical protein